MYQCFGEMAEWLIAPVLKTGVPKGIGGSNPSLSARIYEDVGSKVRLLELSDLQHPDGQKTRMFSWFV